MSCHSWRSVFRNSDLVLQTLFRTLCSTQTLVVLYNRYHSLPDESWCIQHQTAFQNAPLPDVFLCIWCSWSDQTAVSGPGALHQDSKMQGHLPCIRLRTSQPWKQRAGHVTCKRLFIYKNIWGIKCLACIYMIEYKYVHLKLYSDFQSIKPFIVCTY